MYSKYNQQVKEKVKEASLFIVICSCQRTSVLPLLMWLFIFSLDWFPHVILLELRRQKCVKFLILMLQINKDLS